MLVKNHRDVFFVNCVSHSQHYWGCSANFSFENTKKKENNNNKTKQKIKLKKKIQQQQGKESKTGCFQSKVTNCLKKKNRTRPLSDETRTRLRCRSRMLSSLMCLRKILLRYYTIFIEIILTSYPAQNRYTTIERLIKVIGKFTFKINLSCCYKQLGFYRSSN